MVLATQVAPAKTSPAGSGGAAEGPLEPGHLPYNLMHSRLSWPAGTSIFAFRTWAALALAFFLAFILELEAGGGVGTSVLILVAPAQGMVLSKAIYRVAGTLVGAAAALLFTALFPQDRTMLIAIFSVYMGLLVACGTLLRDFRAYGCILAGYTVANISIVNIDAPTSVFLATVDRVAVIILGVMSIAVVNSLFATAESARSLVSKMRAASRDVIAMALYAIDQRAPPDPSQCVAVSARLMPLRSEIGFATPELLDGRARARGARSALLGLFEMISAIQAVGLGLRQLASPSPMVAEAVAITRAALHLQRPETRLPALDAISLNALQTGSLSIEDAYVLDRLRSLVEVLGDVRDGLISMRTGRTPRRVVALPVHQDYFAVVLNGLRVCLIVAIIGSLAVWSGLPGTAETMLGVVIFASLGSVLPDPSVMGKAALTMTPPAIGVATLYTFFIFPNIDGFVLFSLTLVPIAVAMCWLIKNGKGAMGLYFGINTLLLISPGNVQTLDPTAFVDTASFLAVGAVVIFLSFLIIAPVDPAQRRLRLALGVGRNLRYALADKGQLKQPPASLHYDRLSQFKTWQREQTVTLARRRTMTHMSNMGNLAFAVRRAWRAVDRAQPMVEDAINARARKTLPRLSPGDLLELSQVYLTAAQASKGRDGLALANAAAALYATSVLTTDENRLLKRIEFLGRTP